MADAALNGDDVGPLHGIHLGIKESSPPRGAVHGAELILDPAWSDGDAVVVSRLRDAGGIIMGKTTTMESRSHP